MSDLQSAIREHCQEIATTATDLSERAEGADATPLQMARVLVALEGLRAELQRISEPLLRGRRERPASEK